MGKGNLKLKLSLLISIIILIAITVSYSAFFRIDKQIGKTSISSSCFSVDFADGESIDIVGALPLSDSEGIYSNPYVFSLTNNCDYDMTYKVVAYVTNSSINNNLIKYMFSGVTVNTVGNSEPLDNIEGYQLPRVLGTGKIKARTRSLEELRFWLDDQTDIETVKNKSWNAQIKIISGV